MRGGVETAKRLLELGYCYRFVCSQIKCPLNTVELSELVGTVLVTKDRGFHILATAFNPISKEVFLGNEWCDANRLLDLYLRLDGSPVGVLIK